MSSRIPTPATIDASPAASRPLLEEVKKHLGSAPNLFRVMANSPAVLEGYLGLSGALAKGELDARTRERIALAVSELHRCDYCLSAHTYLAKSLAKLDEAEIAANREGGSGDPKADVAVRFAVRLARERGNVTDGDLKALRAAGYGDGQALEILMHVVLTTLTNYVNHVAQTEIDFPVVKHRSV
ncbi:MAG: carboxymuconolactone decarboxylase family protein [Myxococcota bacterium]